MSVKAMAVVWERSRAKGGDKLLLLAIADHADDDGKNAYPSIELLCEKCGGVEPSTIRRAIKRLVAAGELKVYLNQGGSPEWRRLHPDRCPNLYEIPLRHLRRTPRARHDRGGADRTPVAETGNDTPVVPQVTGPPKAQPDGGGANRTPAMPAGARGCADARRGGASTHERECADAPQTIQEPPEEPSIPQTPTPWGLRSEGTNPRATRTSPRDVGTNPRALDVDAFLGVDVPEPDTCPRGCDLGWIDEGAGYEVRCSCGLADVETEGARP